MYLAVFESIVEIEMVVEDPDAIVALGHSVAINQRSNLAHMILYQDDL
jgi:hypothetical protein